VTRRVADWPIPDFGPQKILRETGPVIDAAGKWPGIMIIMTAFFCGSRSVSSVSWRSQKVPGISWGEAMAKKKATMTINQERDVYEAIGAFVFHFSQLEFTIRARLQRGSPLKPRPQALVSPSLALSLMSASALPTPARFRRLGPPMFDSPRIAS
jgi:hypothetical protein